MHAVCLVLTKLQCDTGLKHALKDHLHVWYFLEASSHWPNIFIDHNHFPGHHLFPLYHIAFDELPSYGINSGDTWGQKHI